MQPLRIAFQLGRLHVKSPLRHPKTLVRLVPLVENGMMHDEGKTISDDGCLISDPRNDSGSAYQNISGQGISRPASGTD